MTWSKNSLACKRIWIALRVLEQSSKVFKTSGTVLMKDLKYWTPGASPIIRKAQARSLAIQVDNVFRLLAGAKFDPGVTKKKAVTAMVAVLTKESKTMADLAEAVDALYEF